MAPKGWCTTGFTSKSTMSATTARAAVRTTIARTGITRTAARSWAVSTGIPTILGSGSTPPRRKLCVVAIPLSAPAPHPTAARCTFCRGAQAAAQLRLCSNKDCTSALIMTDRVWAPTPLSQDTMAASCSRLDGLGWAGASHSSHTRGLKAVLPFHRYRRRVARRCCTPTRSAKTASTACWTRR